MSKTGYSKLQVLLHWTIAVMVIIQFIAHENIVMLVDALSVGDEAELMVIILGRSHIILGLAIFSLMIVRVVARFRLNVPDAPEQENAILKFLSKLTHFALYAVLLIMPISGSVAWFFGVEKAAQGHAVGKIILLVFTFLHIGGAVYQHFILKTDVVRRMTKAE
jgi:cytochrome b561